MIFPETEDNKEFSAWCINSRAPIKSKFAEFIYAFQLIKIRNCSLALIFVIILKNDVRRLYASLSSISSPPASKNGNSALCLLSCIFNCLFESSSLSLPVRLPIVHCCQRNRWRIFLSFFLIK